MAFLKKIKDKVFEPKQEPTNIDTDLQKLSVFITIVSRGQGNYVLKLFENEGASAQFVTHGEGTAREEIRDILGIDDNGKEVIFTILKNSNLESAKRELDAFFKVSKKNRGIGFSIPMTSLIGMKVYHFLANTL